MRIFLVIALVLTIAAETCHADIYEDTDAAGVTHFTDDPAKVPRKARKAQGKGSSLSPEESKVVGTMLKLDRVPEIAVKSGELPEFREGVKKFGDAFKDEMGDPAEPADPRLSTPDGALRLFREGLKSGNLDKVRASLTGKLWANGEGFRELQKAQMLELEKGLSKMLVIDKQQDANTAVFRIRDKDTGIGGAIRFINFYGNWKIEHL